jgi:hypothetical protein
MDSQGKAKVALTFALYQGEQLIRRDTIAQDIVKVGKDPRSHLRVDDELASRMHAVIEVASPADITLIDLGNEPGTLVNGQRVNKCKIRPGDQIQIGSTLIHLEDAQVQAATSNEDVVTSAPVAAPAAPRPARSQPAPAIPPPAASPFAASDVAAAANPFAAAPENPFAAAAPANPFASASLGAAGAPNPFAASANPFSSASAGTDASDPYAGAGVVDVDPNAPPGTYTYALVRSGPDVSPDEVEVAHVASIEVRTVWDSNTLRVDHLTPPRSYFVGEEIGDSKQTCDFFVPSEMLGTTRAPIVVANGVSASLVILPRSTGTIDIPGRGKVTLEELVATGHARQSSHLSGAHEFELPAGATARMELEHSGLVFEISAVNAGKPVPAGMFAQFEAAAYIFFGLSLLLHLGTVASLAFFMPHMNGDDSEAIDRDTLLMMQKLLNAEAEREQEKKETEEVTEANADNKEGGSGTRAKGEEGSMGNPTTKETGHKFGVQGPQDNPDPHIAKQAALREAAEFGMIGLLNTGAGGDPNAPTAPWGREDSLGADPMSARGNMWGDAIGDSFGAGGLGLSGVGEGGGGRGEGIGLGGIGTIGHGAGTGNGQGFGNGHGRLGGAHQTRAPSVRQGATQVNGRLPQEVIQRIVRQNFGRFRLCYENGMRTNPNLAGRVTVKFVIDRSGSVATAQDGGSEIPDQGVVACVVRGFGNLSFPQPEGGIVTVVYPIIFNPGE